MPAFVIPLILGLAVGWAVNILSDDLPLRRRPGPIRCEYCGAAHRPVYWLALSSFLLRRGRCEHCTAPRRLRHAIVELASVSALWFLWNRYPETGQFAQAALVTETFLLIAVIDLEHRLILHVVSLPAAALAALVGWFGLDHGFASTLTGGAVGYVVFFGLYFLGGGLSAVIGRLRGREIEEIALGGGDVNLAGVVGLLAGYPAIVVALLIAIFSGGVAALLFLVYRLVRRTYTPFMAIPYGPFLVLGGLAMYVFRPEIAAWALGR